MSHSARVKELRFYTKPWISKAFPAPWPYPKSRRAIAMLPSQALWSLRRLFLCTVSFLMKGLQTHPCPKSRRMTVSGSLWLFSKSFECFHYPAVGGRKWCHINYSHRSHWSPLALRVWWPQIFPQTPFVLCPHGSSVTVFTWISSKVSRAQLTLIFCL